MVDRIAEIWGTRTPHARGEPWPTRIDQFLDDGVDEDAVASLSVPGGSIDVLPAEHLSAEEEERRRQARRAHLETEIGRAEGKLANENFVRKAPAEVVQRERDKLEGYRTELAELGA